MKDKVYAKEYDIHNSRINSSQTVMDFGMLNLRDVYWLCINVLILANYSDLIQIVLSFPFQ